MTHDKVVIKWNEFEESVPTTFRTLWGDPTFSDVTLATADGHQVRAHRVILSSFSEFFKVVLINNHQSNPLLYLKGVNQKNLNNILRFIYVGQCEVDEQDLAEFLDTGKDLKVTGMIDNIGLTDNSLGNVALTKNYPAQTENIELKEQNEEKDEAKPLIMNQDANDVLDTKENFWMDKRKDKKFSCSHCTYGSNQYHHVIEHQKTRHEGKTYLCSICSKEFTSKTTLSYHEQTQHDNIRYSCGKCDSVFTTTRSRQLHTNAKHEGISYDCGHCQYKATQAGSLKRHQQRQHTSET
jgi:hypothetical protein